MTDREAPKMIMDLANRIEALAFEMKAPNAYTPQFIMLANEVRALRARLAQPEPVSNPCQLPEPVRCGKCQGKGRIYMGCDEWIRCTTCNTTGKVTAPPRKEEPESVIDKRLKVKLGSWYGRDLTGHWFYLTPADDDANAALVAHTGGAAPPQREWQGLTDEDLSVCDEDGVLLARYWEAKLREKNV